MSVSHEKLIIIKVQRGFILELLNAKDFAYQRNVQLVLNLPGVIRATIILFQKSLGAFDAIFSRILHRSDSSSSRSIFRVQVSDMGVKTAQRTGGIPFFL
jgi:hypothetical protein